MLETVESDETDAPLLAILMTATVVVTVLTILAAIALFYWKRDSLQKQFAGTSEPVGQALLRGQRARLSDSVWIDKDKGVLSIPMETAKALVVKEGL